MVKIDLDMKLFSARKLKALLNLSKQSGFTLIELLVVIGILGILAAALIATIDPFEQLNKASDANSKNTAVEFLNANIRFYTTHEALPWDTAGGDCLGSGHEDPVLSGLMPEGAMLTCLQNLIVEGELKSSFTTATGILTGLTLNESGGNITMCYLPKSKSQKRDANTKYLAPNGVAGGTGTCPGGVGNSGTCYWCTL